MNIRETIVKDRIARINELSHQMGCEVPVAREVPLVPFLAAPEIICEVKRRSPSRGDIHANMDPVAQARRYYDAGIRSVSCLTEEEYFSGSLKDLMAIKAELPELAVLRKDFLVDLEDVEVSYRAGADAILLIASVLEPALLADMQRRAHQLGMQALVEVHTPAEIDAVRPAAPQLVGINARDLSDFSVDLLLPIRLRERIDWPARTVFESGIWHGEQADMATSNGFDGILVGESVVRHPERIPELIEGVSHPGRDFWARLQHLKQDGRPLVKICGLAREEDALLGEKLGADVLGFVFADSPRRADADLVRSLPRGRALRVAVVQARRTGAGFALDPEVAALLSEGLIDALQYHGDEMPQECARPGYPYYKALRVRGADDIEAAGTYRCPRILADSFVKGLPGGTGTRLETGLVRELSARTPGLWLAGGLNADNVATIIAEHRPELIDVSSGLESAPAQKDHKLMERYFKEIDHASRV